NTASGFEMIGGVPATLNPTHAEYAVPEDRGRHVSIVQVRRDGVRAYVDGRQISQWKTDYKDFEGPALVWRLRTPLLGLGTGQSPTVFHRAEILEVAGKGKALRKANAPFDLGGKQEGESLCVLACAGHTEI